MLTKLTVVIISMLNNNAAHLKWMQCYALSSISIKLGGGGWYNKNHKTRTNLDFYFQCKYLSKMKVK